MPQRQQFSLLRIEKAGGDFHCCLKNENPCDASTHWTTAYERAGHFYSSSSPLPTFDQSNISAPHLEGPVLETNLPSHRFSDTVPHSEFFNVECKYVIEL